MRLKHGYTHIYTGCGKGKTSAVMGLGMRAALSGFKVCMFQFLKKKRTSAENNLSMPNFKAVCFDEAHPLFKKCIAKKLKKRIMSDIGKAKRVMESKRYDVIILDEIVNCVSCAFIKEDAVLDLIKAKPKRVELVLTGRNATGRLIAAADYVTRLDKVKHPFDKGVRARRGIEY